MSASFECGYALLIGVTQNLVAKLALPGVGNDVAALREVLTHPERCAYPASHVRVLTGNAASRQGILAGLNWLRAEASPASTMIVFYSGHGWRSLAGGAEEFFLIPYDVQENAYRSSALSASDFARAIHALQPGRLLVVLDCCHAGEMLSKDLPAGEPLFSEMALAPGLLMPEDEGQTKGVETLSQGSGRAVISSSKGEQRSYLRRDRTMSIFTYHLVAALSGQAGSVPGATEILVSDVMSHVYREVPRTALREAGAVQEPDYQVRGNFPVALLLGGKGLAEGQAPPDLIRTPKDEVDGEHFPMKADLPQQKTGRGITISGQVGDVGPGSQVAIGMGIHQQSLRLDREELAARDRRQARLQRLEKALETLMLGQRELGVARYNLRQMKEELVEKELPPDLLRVQAAVDWLIQSTPAMRAELEAFFADADIRQRIAAGEGGALWLQERFSGG